MAPITTQKLLEIPATWFAVVVTGVISFDQHLDDKQSMLKVARRTVDMDAQKITVVCGWTG